MKKWMMPLVMIFWTLTTPSHGLAQENAHRFIAAMEAYKAQDYGTAVREMEHIARSGVRSGALYYNLGNAYLKDNRLGHAILWYERALKLIPDDPDLRFNAAHARSLTRDAEDDETVSVLRVIFFWKHRLSNRTIGALALTLNLLFWCCLIAKKITGRRGFRYAAIAVAAPALVFIMTGFFNYYESSYRRHGIVLEEEVSVRSGLDQTSTELFVLHAGTKLTVVKQNKTHLQVQFGKDKIGWIERRVLGLI